MINKLNIKAVLEELNKSLNAKSLKREFSIFGSGALLIQGLSPEDRATIDIDMIDPEIDQDLLLLSMEISEQLGLEVSWLNSAGYIFSKNLPTGWKERLIVVFKDTNLVVKSLSKKDLISSKILAYCQRRSNTDLIDLKSLAPHDETLKEAEVWLSQRPDYLQIQSTFNELKNLLESEGL